MKISTTPYILRQAMQEEKVEMFHYDDVSFSKVSPHSHNHYEFYFFLNGNIRYNIGDSQFNMQPGDFLIIKPGLLHFPEVRLSNDDIRYERFVIWMSTDYANTILEKDNLLEYALGEYLSKGHYHFRPDRTMQTKILNLLSDLIEETSDKKPGFQMAIDALLSQLFVNLSRVITNKDNVRREDVAPDLYASIIRYIHANLRSPLTLDEIASEFYVSKGYISRIFKQHLNISVHQYVIKVKVENVLAEASVRGGEVTEIAYEYGFSNYSTFYRECQKLYGKSPRKMLE